MNVLPRTNRRASLRALVGITAVALTAGAALAPTAASAALVPAAPGQTGLYGAAYAGYDGVYRQSLAILGLYAADVEPDERAVGWLLDQQCSNGGFSSFNPDPSAECAPFDGASYSGGTDTNATALAVQALLTVGEESAAEDAAEYLAGVQNTDGGWEYTPEAPFASSDPNSTGLVLTALNAAAVAPPNVEDSPLDYFLGLQVGRTGVPAQFDGDEGGITSPYSSGYGDSYATPQVVPGLLGDDLTAVPTPFLPTWAKTAEVTGTPDTDRAGVADWAAEWIETNANDLPGGMTAWAVLSFASTATGRVAAQDLYEDIKDGVEPTNPGALGQAALAAASLGENADVQRYASLISATLTTLEGRDSDAPAEHAASLTSSWTNQNVTVSNPYVGTELPIKQTVIWGDGSTTPLTGATASHAYSRAGTYKPQVRVEFADLPRPGYVGLDAVTVAKPTATLRLSRSTAWAGTSVTLTKSAVTGAPSNVTVAWGDGTTSNITSVSSAAHTYKAAGTFTPVVTLANGTGGTATLGATPVSVKVTKDTGKPSVSVTTPSSKKKVGSWRTVRGTAKDSGIGVKTVTVKLVEKRAGKWYSYNGKKWTKRTSYAKAVKAAKSIRVTPTAKGTWSLKVAKLKKGKLKISYSATDKAGNRSATKSRTASLTK